MAPVSGALDASLFISVLRVDLRQVKRCEGLRVSIRANVVIIHIF